MLHTDPAGELIQSLRRVSGGTFIVNAGFSTVTTRDEAVPALNEGIADLITVVIAEDTALPPEQSKLLAISLVGIAQVSARYWVRSGMSIPVEEATSLVSRLAWRGIRGFPLSHYDASRLR